MSGLIERYKAELNRKLGQQRALLGELRTQRDRFESTQRSLLTELFGLQSGWQAWMNAPGGEKGSPFASAARELVDASTADALRLSEALPTWRQQSLEEGVFPPGCAAPEEHEQWLAELESRLASIEQLLRADPASSAAGGLKGRISQLRPQLRDSSEALRRWSQGFERFRAQVQAGSEFQALLPSIEAFSAARLRAVADDKRLQDLLSKYQHGERYENAHRQLREHLKALKGSEDESEASSLVEEIVKARPRHWFEEPELNRAASKHKKLLAEAERLWNDSSWSEDSLQEWCEEQAEALTELADLVSEYEDSHRSYVEELQQCEEELGAFLESHRKAQQAEAAQKTASKAPQAPPQVPVGGKVADRPASAPPKANSASEPEKASAAHNASPKAASTARAGEKKTSASPKRSVVEVRQVLQYEEARKAFDQEQKKAWALRLPESARRELSQLSAWRAALPARLLLGSEVPAELPRWMQELRAKTLRLRQLAEPKTLETKAPEKDPFESIGRARGPMFERVDRLSKELGPKMALRREESRLVTQLGQLELSVDKARPLVSDGHQALFASVAALDAGLAKARGRSGSQLQASTREVAQTLGEMAALAERVGLQSASSLKAVRELMEQRREALAKLAVGESPDGKARPSDHLALDGVSRQIPGLSKVLAPMERGSAARKRSVVLGAPRRGAEGLQKVLESSSARSSSAGFLQAATGIGVLQSLGQVPGGGMLTVNEVLSGRLGRPLAKSWFSSIGSAVSGAVGGLAKLGTSAVKKGISTMTRVTTSAAKTLGSVALGGAKAVSGGLSALKQTAKGGLALVVKGAGKAWDGVKKTGAALGRGMSAVTSAVGTAAAYAYDSTKHAIKTIGSGAKALAEATGRGIKSAWSSVTGVVGAVGGKIKQGLSSAASWVGDKAKKVGGALLQAGKFVVKHHPLAALAKVGWDKFGKNVWDKTKNLASVAWEGAKKVGKSVGTFLQSPAGQLLTTGLSIAATFIPGGLLVKAGVGAVMGAIEAVSKGGGLKEALIGAAAGGLEGAIPLMKLKTVGKLALGGVKGGLQAAVNGGDFGDIAKGALGGAWDVGGMGVLKKFGGGRGVKMLDTFMGGGGQHKGVLGKLQKFTQNGVIQKLYGGVKKAAPKIVKGATWVYEKSGKLHNVLEKVSKGGEYVKGALEGVSWLSNLGAEKLGADSGLGRFLADVSDLSGKGASGLEKPLEYVKKVDDVVSKVHKYTGTTMKLVGVDPRRAQKEAERKRELQRKLRKDIESNPDLSPEERSRKLAEIDKRTSSFDRLDNWFFNKTEKVTSKVTDRTSALQKTFNSRLGALKGKLASTPLGVKILQGGRVLGDWGSKGHAHLKTISGLYSKGIKVGDAIQEKLRDFVLLTEGAESGQWGGEQLKWAHEYAVKLEKSLDDNLKTAKEIEKVSNLVVDSSGVLLDATGNTEKRKKYSERAEIWWGTKKADPKNKEQASAPVAPWVKYGNTLDEKLMGTEKDPTKLKQRLDALEKWRSDVKKAANQVAKHNAVVGDDDKHKVPASRSDAGLRLLGGDEAGDRDEQWKAYEERRKKAEEAAAASSTPAASISKELNAQAEAKTEELAKKEAKGIEKEETEILRSPKGQELSEEESRSESGARSNDELQKMIGELIRLETLRADLIAEGKAGKVHPAHRTAALLLLTRIEWLGKQSGGDLSSQREQALGLMAFFNGGEAYHADDDRQGGEKTGLAALVPAKETALELVSDEEGIAGSVEKPGAGALEKLQEEKAEPRFEFLVRSLADWEERLNRDIPLLESLIILESSTATKFHLHLLKAGQSAAQEIERLGGSLRPEDAQAGTLVRLAERYAALRGRLRALGERLPAEEKAAAPELPVAEEGTLVESGPSGGTTEASEVASAEGGAGPSYLDEVVEDTWIGSGAAARPIADGLANGFKFEDIDGAKPTLGAALGRLGGALQGLGGSLKGAAGDVSGLMGEVGESAGILQDMGGTVGELVGAGRDNGFTQALGKGGEFAELVRKGADDFAPTGDKITEAGGKITEAGRKLEEKGVRLFGRVYRKGRSGSVRTTNDPAVSGDQYLDAPQRLDHAVTLQMERFLGASFRDVKIHTGRGAELITKRYDAEAVTIREHIFFAPGRFSPSSTEGRKLLAHELTHVKQRGRPNLDTRTAEEEAHKAEALYGAPGMEVLDLSQPQADFQLAMAGAETVSGGVRTAKKQRSASADSSSFDEGADGEELLDLVGERVYELMLADIEKEYENR